MLRVLVGLLTKFVLVFVGSSFVALAGGAIGIGLAFLFEFAPSNDQSARPYTAPEGMAVPTRAAEVTSEFRRPEEELAKLQYHAVDDGFELPPKAFSDAKAQVAPTIPSGCDVASTSPANSDAAVIGDRVRLSFFETLDLPQSSSTTSDVSTKVAHERLDLSGTFSVDQDGMVSAPLIGRVEVLGRSISCLESVFARAAFEAGIPNLTVSAAYAHRPFVIAQGDLRTPGRYDFAPGMTVRHLVTIAGAPTPDAGALSVEEENRLMARNEELNRALMGTMVKRSRILAALEGQEVLQLDPEQRISVRQVLGQDLIDAETKVLKADLELWRAKTAQQRIKIRELDSLVAQKQKQIIIIDDFLGRTKERYEEMRAHLERGVIKESALIDLESKMIEVEKSLIDAQSDLIELKSHETKGYAAIEMEKVKYYGLLTRELQEVSEQALGYENQIKAIDAMLNAAKRPSEPLFALSISRAGKEDRIRFNADWDTPVLPGDVLSAKLVPSEAGSDWARARGAPSGYLHLVEKNK